jgi:rhodanese-related sulfurtransferase
MEQGKEVSMGRRFLAIAALVFFISCLMTGALGADKTPEQLVKEAREAIKEVSIDDVKKMMDNKEKVIILDIRDKEEYLSGHIPGAINMSRGLLDFHIHEIISDKEDRLTTDFLKYSGSEQRIYTEGAVKMENARMQVRGVGMSLSLADKDVTLLSRVRANIR